LPLRILVDILFMMHGRPKLFRPQRPQMREFFRQVGIPLPAVGLFLAGSVEFFGGLLLIIGLLVPIVALLLLCVMSVATYVSIVKLHKPPLAVEKPGYEYDLVLIVVALAFALSGAGPLSLDVLLGLWRWCA
jgi:putative oxidoreductase